MGTAASLPTARAPLPRAPAALLSMRSDEALVARARAGDRVAFEVLYERHVPGVLSFCRHMLGSREEGEDAVQQTFTSAHSELTAGGQRELRFKPWIYAVARNRCISVLRARRPETVELREVPATAGLAEQVSVRAELRELLADLAELGDEQRAALVLIELGDLSYADVGRVLGREEQSVKGIVFRARAALGERREARDAECDEIRAQLAIARRGALRRGVLRHHLSKCPGCTEYLEDLRRQRRLLAIVLPVTPTLGLKESVMAATGAGATAGGGALIAVGVGSTVAKIAVAAAVTAGGGVAAERVVGAASPPPPRPAGVEKATLAAPGTAEPARRLDTGAMHPAERRRVESAPGDQARRHPAAPPAGDAHTPGHAHPEPARGPGSTGDRPGGPSGRPDVPGAGGGGGDGSPKPAKPPKPAAPAAPGKPDKPGKPPAANKPDKPDNPNKPQEPGKPPAADKPDNPNKPDKGPK